MLDWKITLAILLGSAALISGVGLLWCSGTKSAAPITDGVSMETLSAFNSWQKQFGKVYLTQDEATYRLAQFAIAQVRIAKTNADPMNTYKAALNQFSDMSIDEFRQRILMATLPSVTGATNEVPNVPIADEVDWRQKGAVTPVKDQGQCGSCWSFSTTGTLEGANFLFGSKKLLNFAEQQLVDCCGKQGFQCQGCSGAWPEWAVNYVISKGITTQDQYSYTAREGTCKDSTVTQQFKVSGYNLITSGSDADLLALINTQPVSVCVDATTWFDYSSGVYNGCPSSIQLDHAVTLVGYTKDYYIVKNSWNTSWGEQGLIRLPRGKNACGIASHALTVKL